MNKQLNLAMQAAEIEVIKKRVNKKRKRYILIKKLPHTIHMEASEGLKTKGFKLIMDKNKDKIAEFKAGSDKTIMIW